MVHEKYWLNWLINEKYPNDNWLNWIVNEKYPNVNEKYLILVYNHNLKLLSLATISEMFQSSLLKIEDHDIELFKHL